MANEALYQKYRSGTFDEVVGQQYVVRSLQNALKSGKIGHAYLFCGPRGTGKTTMARLLAKAVNCEHPESAPCGHCASCRAVSEGNHPDVIEINAANETHIENIRDLIERAQLAPMMSPHKIYIIDEVHQLSNAAASALLKTLEEPPAQVIFILATTDPQKLLPTIISRCQRFDFAKVPPELIKDHLLHIAQSEGFVLEDDAAARIASLADGGMRDALSMLEQASSFADGAVTADAVDEIYGLVSNEELIGLLEDIFAGNLAEVLGRIEKQEERGADLRRMTEDLITVLKDAVILQYTGKTELLRKLTPEQAEELSTVCEARKALKTADLFMEAAGAYRTARSVKDVLELTCMKAVPERTERAAVVIPPHKKEPVEDKKTIISEPEMIVKPDSMPEPLPEPEPVKEAPGTVFTSEDVLSLLVQCDKNSKAADAELFRIWKDMIPDNRHMAEIQQTELLASGKDCILLGCEEEGIAERINDPEENRELYFWLRDSGIDRIPFAVLRSVYDEAVRTFIRRRNEGSLPPARTITRYITVEQKEDDPLETVKRLFGNTDVLEVIES